jgi:hypothetical protein
MISPDVMVLVYAHRADVPEHSDYEHWLEGVARSPEPFALSELVLSAFLRIVTHRKVFADPTPLSVAMRFLDGLLALPTCRPVRPGPRHWQIFVSLCQQSRAHGKLVADAYHAALAIEHGCEWLSVDPDFGRFPGLRWRHPLALPQPE